MQPSKSKKRGKNREFRTQAEPRLGAGDLSSIARYVSDTVLGRSWRYAYGLVLQAVRPSRGATRALR
jgi:hypothetical protein